MKKSFGVKNGFKRKKFSRGFTFVETIAVLSITAILAAGSSVSVSKFINMAKKSSSKNQIEQYKFALQAYFLDCGCFPTTEQGLASLWEKPILYPIPENWGGPYIESEPGRDSWGFNFEYINTDDSIVSQEIPKNVPFVVKSLGKDGMEGGSGENEDIVSWK
jgi:general secretion pathway protein G